MKLDLGTRDLLSLYLLIGLVTVADGWIQVTLSPYLATMEYTVPEIGFLISLLAMLQFISRLPAGLLYSRRGPKTLSAIGIGLVTLAIAGLGLQPMGWLVAILLCLYGLATGTITTVMMALCVDSKPAHLTLGGVMGWYMTAISIGFSIGQVTAGWVSDQLGFSTGFVLVASVELLGMLIALCLLRPIPRSRVSQPSSGLAPKEAAGKLRIRGVHIPRLPVNALTAGGTMFLFTCLLAILNTFFPLYALGLGLTLTQVGWLRGCMSLAATIIRPMSGFLFARMDHRRVNHVSILLGSLFIGLIPVVVSFSWLLPVFISIGLNMGILRVGTATLASQPEPDQVNRNMGLSAGIYNAALDTGFIVGPIIGAFIVAATSIKVLLFSLPSAVVFTYLGLLYLNRLAARKTQTTTTAEN